MAFRVARQQAAGETPCVVLSTASPYKFPCDVLGALGADVPEDEFEAMRLPVSYTHLLCRRSVGYECLNKHGGLYNNGRNENHYRRHD